MDVDISECKIEEIEKFRADIAKETLVPVFCKTFRFMDAIEKLGELRERLEEKARVAADLYFNEDSP